MVKYGVPDPVACWAMSIGIPFRRVAMRLAVAYRAATADTRHIGYEGFMEWVAGITSEDLYREYGLRAPLLEDVARAIYTYAANPTLHRFEDLNSFLPTNVPVRGVRYENRATVAMTAQIGQTLLLKRDYDNLVDRNAIGVFVGGEQIGFVPREVAQILAPEMDVGTRLLATVTGVERVPSPQVIVRLERQL